MKSRYYAPPIKPPLTPTLSIEYEKRYGMPFVTSRLRPGTFLISNEDQSLFLYAMHNPNTFGIWKARPTGKSDGENHLWEIYGIETQ